MAECALSDSGRRDDEFGGASISVFGADAGTGADAGSGPDAGSGAGTGPDAGSGPDAGPDAGTGAGTGTDAGTGADAGTDAGTGPDLGVRLPHPEKQGPVKIEVPRSAFPSSEILRDGAGRFKVFDPSDDEPLRRRSGSLYTSFPDGYEAAGEDWYAWEAQPISLISFSTTPANCAVRLAAPARF